MDPAILDIKIPRSQLLCEFQTNSFSISEKYKIKLQSDFLKNLATESNDSISKIIQSTKLEKTNILNIPNKSNKSNKSNSENDSYIIGISPSMR